MIVRSVGDSLDHLIGSFPGPIGDFINSCTGGVGLTWDDAVGTSYEGGLFQVAIEPPPNYPFSPLKVRHSLPSALLLPLPPLRTPT